MAYILARDNSHKLQLGEFRVDTGKLFREEVTVVMEEMARKAVNLIFPVNHTNTNLVLEMIVFLVGGETR